MGGTHKIDRIRRAHAQRVAPPLLQVPPTEKSMAGTVQVLVNFTRKAPVSKNLIMSPMAICICMYVPSVLLKEIHLKTVGAPFQKTSKALH